jgi:hypothetical protein
LRFLECIAFFLTAISTSTYGLFVGNASVTIYALHVKRLLTQEAGLISIASGHLGALRWQRLKR